MPTDYVVGQKESVLSIAYKQGFFWETIWNQPKNSSLKSKRPDPNVLLPGDVLHIPDLIEKFESAADAQKHSFKRKGTPALLRIYFVRQKEEAGKVDLESTDRSVYQVPEPAADDNEPMKDKPYVLYSDGVVIKNGNTDGKGKVEAKIPAGTSAVVIVFEPGTCRERSIDLNIHGMDPVEEVPGICKRLNNLGFPCTLEQSTITVQVEDALRAFQQMYKIEPTGKADDATKTKLKEIHGS